MKLSELIREELSTSAETGTDLPKSITARLNECVKPLEWVDFKTESLSVCGLYEVSDLDSRLGGIVRLLHASFGTQYLGDFRDNVDRNRAIEAAKAAAQAHYAAQIIAGFEL